MSIYNVQDRTWLLDIGELWARGVTGFGDPIKINLLYRRIDYFIFIILETCIQVCNKIEQIIFFIVISYTKLSNKSFNQNTATNYSNLYVTTN